MVYRSITSAVVYRVQSTDSITDAVIVGYEVTRFGVPMIGEYVNTGRGRRVTITPAVPGAQYRITAWAIGDGRRSTTPAVEYATTGSECMHIIVQTLMCACARARVCKHRQQRPFSNDHLEHFANLNCCNGSNLNFNQHVHMRYAWMVTSCILLQML